MPDPSLDHRVIVFATPGDSRELSDLLAEKLSLHPTDARIHAHAVPGLLPDHLSQQQAEELAADIGNLGIRAAAIPAADVPNFRHAEILHHVRCLENGLEIVELHGEPECLVTWDDIQLISVGYVPQEARHRVQVDSTLVYAAPQHHHDEADTPPISGFEAWIVRRDPLTGFRIEHSHMNYEYLGDRKTASATHNFRLFMEDLVGKTPAAYVTPAARAYVGHGLLRHYEFRSQEEHRRYAVFHLLLLRQMQNG